MSFKGLSRDYLTFTRKERIGLLVIAAIIMGIVILPKVTVSGRSEFTAGDTAWMTAAKQLLHDTEDSDQTNTREAKADVLVYERPGEDDLTKSSGQLFYFDPNTLSIEEWIKLGVRKKTAVTIQKYLNKGGHFYKPEDLQKIYGIRSNDYRRLEPYIKIETQQASGHSYPKEVNKQHASNASSYSIIEINTADTAQFISLPGIGSKLASRIVNFRDKLGGFYSVDQIAETYGLPDSTFQKIKPFLKIENFSPRKFNINSATKDEMKSHPYIKWAIANAIVEYRNQHGLFSSLEDLKKVSLVTDEVFNKIKFYLAL